MKSKEGIPTSQVKWQSLFVNEEEVYLEARWKFWYLLPYRISREVRLQSFQFRVMHRIIPCNKYLSLIRIRESSTCSFCEEEDDLYHFFLGCSDTNTFWTSVDLWLQENSLTTQSLGNLSEIEFLFGIPSLEPEDYRRNFILLLGKFYIAREKVFGEGKLDTYAFLMELKHVLSVERIACGKEKGNGDKFEVWSEFYYEL